MGEVYRRKGEDFMVGIKWIILIFQLTIQAMILIWQKKTHSMSPIPVVLVTIVGITGVVLIYSI